MARLPQAVEQQGQVVVVVEALYRDLGKKIEDIGAVLGVFLVQKIGAAASGSLAPLASHAFLTPRHRWQEEKLYLWAPLLRQGLFLRGIT